MIRALASVLLGTVLLATVGDAHAGLLILSGDNTPVFSLTNTNPNSQSAGNRIFFFNALRGGNRVAVLDSSPNPFSAAEVHEYYDSLSGITSSLVNGAVTADLLSEVDLFVAPVPDDEFTAAEIGAIGAFLNSGGTFFLMGEGHTVRFSQNDPPYGETANPIINRLLEALGSSMRLNAETLEVGPHMVTVDQVALETPETFGLLTSQSLAASFGMGFAYGATTTVEGGTPLLYTTGPFPPFIPRGEPFLAVESLTVPVAPNPVPEPSTLALFVLGMIGMGGCGRHFRRNETKC